MKNRLMRPAAALFPITLLAGFYFGWSSIVAELTLFYLFMQLFSLCAVDCFRNAAAREPGRRRVDKRFWGSLLPLLLSPAICTALAIWRGDSHRFELIAAAWCILIEQLFEERLYTLNHRGDGNLLSLISSGLLFTGLMLDSANGLPMPFYLQGFYTTAASALGMFIAVIASLFIATPKGFSWIRRNLGFAAKAMLQTVRCPALFFAIAAYNIDWRADYPILVFRSGFAKAMLPALILWRLARTTCRRSADESRPLNLLLVTAVSALVIAGLRFDFLIAPALSAYIALLCALIVFLRPSWRNIGGTVLIFLALMAIVMEISHHMPIAIACCLIAIGINLKNAFLKKV